MRPAAEWHRAGLAVANLSRHGPPRATAAISMWVGWLRLSGTWIAMAVARQFTDFAPPARPLLVSSVEAASGYAVIRLPIGWVGDPHLSRHRQMLFCLSKKLKVTSQLDGDVRVISKRRWR